MPLTEFQQEYLRSCSHRWNVKTGATRSGKTYLDCAVTIPKRICAARGEGLLVMLGNTLGTLERNVLEPMRGLWGPELVGVVRTSASGNMVQLFGRKVYVLGADNKKHIARIQGAAFEYAYGDEITTWDEGVFQMLKSACPVRTVISTAPATRKAPPTGSKNSSTAMPTSTVRPTPSTTTRPFRPSSWPT